MNYNNIANNVSTEGLYTYFSNQLKEKPADKKLQLKVDMYYASLYTASPRKAHDELVMKSIKTNMIGCSDLSGLYRTYEENLKNLKTLFDAVPQSRDIPEKTLTDEVREKYIKEAFSSCDLNPIAFKEFQQIAQDLKSATFIELTRLPAESEKSIEALYDSLLEQVGNKPTDKSLKLNMHTSFANLCGISKRKAHDLRFKEIKEQMPGNGDIKSLYAEYRKLCKEEISLHKSYIKEAETIAKELNTPAAHSNARYISNILKIQVDLSPMPFEQFKKIVKQEGAVLLSPSASPSRKRKAESSDEEMLTSPKSGSSTSSSEELMSPTSDIEIPEKKFKERPAFVFPK